MKIKSICVIGANDETAPSEMKVYVVVPSYAVNMPRRFVNREDIDFQNADDIQAAQVNTISDLNHAL